MSYINATREQIVAALEAGHSVNRINRDLRADRARIRAIRNELQLPVYVRPEQTRTIEEKWRLYAKPVDGGHVEWTGERGKASGTPLLCFKDKHHSAAAVAFRIRTGRDPQGYALADCGVKHCVAPQHVEDEPGRRRNREQLRYLRGGRALPDRCQAGHDLSEHGRIGTDGRAYCNTCKRDREQVAA
ncbi:hypothetical protein ACH4JS_26680 [Streptomyces sp. NPDC017638]|uniref:hypothetical protein n=1 Tax=Streptomyces sp. NPDC017638 TaxID=3365004 RepID=UPI0037A06675